MVSISDWQNGKIQYDIVHQMLWSLFLRKANIVIPATSCLLNVEGSKYCGTEFRTERVVTVGQKLHENGSLRRLDRICIRAGESVSSVQGDIIYQTIISGTSWDIVVSKYLEFYYQFSYSGVAHRFHEKVKKKSPENRKSYFTLPAWISAILKNA